MSLRNDFNPHLADAYCTSIMLGHEDAHVILNLPTFPHHLLAEKFADAILENNIFLMNKLYETGLININDFCRDEQETFLTFALKNRFAYKGNPYSMIATRKETNTQTVRLETIETILSYPETNAGQLNKRNEAPIVLAITPCDSRPFMMMIPRPDIDVNVANIWGKTLLMELVHKEGAAIEKMLSATLARPELNKNAVTDYGVSAAMYAAGNEDNNILNLFLSCGGIDLECICKNGHQVLDFTSGNPNNYNAIMAAMNPNP